MEVWEATKTLTPAVKSDQVRQLPLFTRMRKVKRGVKLGFVRHCEMTVTLAQCVECIAGNTTYLFCYNRRIFLHTLHLTSLSASVAVMLGGRSGHCTRTGHPRHDSR